MKLKRKIFILILIFFYSCGNSKFTSEHLVNQGFLSYRLFNEEHNYYVFNDTVKIETPKEKTLFLPNTNKKYTKRKFGKKMYYSELEWGNLYGRWTTNYVVEEFPKDTKTISGLKGIKIVINETSIRSTDTFEEVYELYVFDKIKFPFKYYSFLNLKDTLNLSGLILECKTYFKDTPNYSIIYTLEKFNTLEQNKELKNIDFNKYIYRRL